MNAFFPDLYFAWAFYGVLVLFTLVASYADLRWIAVPKAISLSALAAGLLFNLVRGAWLGAEGKLVWQFGAHGSVVGALDGLCFSLVGFAVGFGLFFVLWVLGVCGGGDVKLFAAVSAWVGPYHAVWLLAGSTMVMLMFAFVRLVLMLLAGTKRNSNQNADPGGKADGAKKPFQRLMAYSLPLAIATAVIMLWFYRHELQIAVPGSGPQVQGVRSHGP